MKKTKKHLRLDRCFVAIVLVFFAAMLISDNAEASGPARELVPVTVAAGDTLWELVEENYQYSGDIRDAIYEVKQINQMNSSALMIGQIVYIPAK